MPLHSKTGSVNRNAPKTCKSFYNVLNGSPLPRLRSTTPNFTKKQSSTPLENARYVDDESRAKSKSSITQLNAFDDQSNNMQLKASNCDIDFSEERSLDEKNAKSS